MPKLVTASFVIRFIPLILGALLLPTVARTFDDPRKDQPSTKAQDERLKTVPSLTDSSMWDKLPGSSQLDYAQSDIFFFPTLVVADVPVYNLPGIRGRLNFTPRALAGIYLGRITVWSDPAIASVNPGIRLPHKGITVVHRDDETGGTVLWTDYLSKIDSQWKESVGEGSVVKWPIGIGTKGDEALAKLIRQTPFSIGYLERWFVVRAGLTFGRVQNSAGHFVAADKASMAAAVTDELGALDFSSSPSITNSPGWYSYPISGFSGLLVPTRMSDPQKKKAMLDLTRWIITKGQGKAAADGYVPLPATIVDKEIKVLDALTD